MMNTMVMDATENLLEPRAAAVELLPDFQRLARALAPKDPSVRDDLVQEMTLAALECKTAHTPCEYKRLAGWRAKDWLRWWVGQAKGKTRI